MRAHHVAESAKLDRHEPQQYAEHPRPHRPQLRYALPETHARREGQRSALTRDSNAPDIYTRCWLAACLRLAHYDGVHDQGGHLRPAIPSHCTVYGGWARPVRCTVGGRPYSPAPPPSRRARSSCSSERQCRRKSTLTVQEHSPCKLWASPSTRTHLRHHTTLTLSRRGAHESQGLVLALTGSGHVPGHCLVMRPVGRRPRAASPGAIERRRAGQASARPGPVPARRRPRPRPGLVACKRPRARHLCGIGRQPGELDRHGEAAEHVDAVHDRRRGVQPEQQLPYVAETLQIRIPARRSPRRREGRPPTGHEQLLARYAKLTLASMATETPVLRRVHGAPRLVSGTVWALQSTTAVARDKAGT